MQRHEFYADTDIPVGRASTRKDTGEAIRYDDIVMRAQATTGESIVLTNDYIAMATSLRPGQAEIIALVPVNETGRWVFTEVRQVRPKANKGVVDPAVAKAWALVLDALFDADEALVVKVALRARLATACSPRRPICTPSWLPTVTATFCLSRLTHPSATPRRRWPRRCSTPSPTSRASAHWSMRRPWRSKRGSSGGGGRGCDRGGSDLHGGCSGRGSDGDAGSLGRGHQG